MTVNWLQKQTAHGRTIARAGISGLLRRLAPASGGTPSGASPADYPIALMVVEYDEDERGNSLIVQGDRKAEIAAAGLPIVPTETDFVIINDDPVTGGPVVYSIVRLESVKPGGIPIRYTAQIRL